MSNLIQSPYQRKDINRSRGWKSDICPQSNYQTDRISPSEHPDVFYNDQQAVRHPQKRENFEESEDDDEISDSEEEVLSDQLTDFNDDLEALVLKAVGGDLYARFSFVLFSLNIPSRHSLFFFRKELVFRKQSTNEYQGIGCILNTNLP